jgi:hypothetical protein
MERAAVANLNGNRNFAVRRALERLREGLYDPFAVRLMTAYREELDAQFHADLQRLQAGDAVHLCVSGPYGQGKSHTLTYLRERALELGYVVSAINLDPREAPLHQFRQVYRALLDALTIPSDSATPSAPASIVEVWQDWAKSQPLRSEEPSTELAALLPSGMPHAFKATLVALARETVHVPQGARVLKRYRDYRPTEFPAILHRTLSGETIPVARLRPALKYRQVAFYRDASLTLPGDEPFLQMISACAQLFRRMGYKGWVLLFDEGEAMIQVRSPLRARSYRILHHLLYPPTSQSGFYAVFACTPDFFQQIREEDYDLPYFDRDYAAAWRDLSIYQLRSLSRDAWLDLCKTLITLHGEAYQWTAEQDHLLPRLTERLGTLPQQDTRVTLKALVDELDQVQQQAFFTRM